MSCQVFAYSHNIRVGIIGEWKCSFTALVDIIQIEEQSGPATYSALILSPRGQDPVPRAARDMMSFCWSVGRVEMYIVMSATAVMNNLTINAQCSSSFDLNETKPVCQIC